jgi:tetratricopeptide (TPR) repeat protein
LPGEALYAFRKTQTFEDYPQLMGVSLGIVLASLGAQSSAVEEFVYILKDHPGLMDDLPSLALNLSRANLLDFGYAFFSRLDAMGKLDAKGMSLFASFPFQKKDYETALEILERALSIDPNEPNVFLLMGEIYYRNGEKQEMKRAYRRFLELNPNAPQRTELEKRIQE